MNLFLATLSYGMVDILTLSEPLKEAVYILHLVYAVVEGRNVQGGGKDAKLFGSINLDGVQLLMCSGASPNFKDPHL